MKKMLLACVLGSTLVSSFPAHADVGIGHNVRWGNLMLGLRARVSNTTALAAAAIGLSAAGTWYILSCLPSWRLYSAQKTYDSLDAKFITFLAEVDSLNPDQIDGLAVAWYPASTCPLVASFNELKTAYEATNYAISQLDAAIAGSKDPVLVASCITLKALLSDRLAPFQVALARLRSHALWAQEYSQYLQECNNERLARLETAIQFQSLSHR